MRPAIALLKQQPFDYVFLQRTYKITRVVDHRRGQGADAMEKNDRRKCAIKINESGRLKRQQTTQFEPSKCYIITARRLREQVVYNEKPNICRLKYMCRCMYLRSE